MVKNITYTSFRWPEIEFSLLLQDTLHRNKVFVGKKKFDLQQKDDSTFVMTPRRRSVNVETNE